MFIAYLDILGFSRLVKEDVITAYDAITSVERRKITQFEDDKVGDKEGVEENILDENILEKIRSLSKRSSIITFDDFISGSDSIVIMSKEDNPLFMRNLSHFVAAIFMLSAKPFQKDFEDMDRVLSPLIGTWDGYSMRLHKAVPVLLRGGIAWEPGQGAVLDIKNIINKELQPSWNIIGETFLKAVRAESRGKGPRLFCDQSIIDWINASSESDVKELKKLIRCVEDDGKKTYELVWTIDACECDVASSGGVSLTDPMSNVCSRMTENLFLPAKNLYKGYKKKGDEEAVKHYEELMHLIVNGLLKYPQNNGIADVKTIEDGLSKRMSNIGLAVTDWYKFMDE